MKLTGDKCLCTVCREAFYSTDAFDFHRRGSFTKRICRTPKQMVRARMRKVAGTWWNLPSVSAE